MKLYTFTGAHSTGKTTLLLKLKNDERFKHWKFVEEITRSIAKAGKRINEDGDDDTQRMIIDSHNKNIIDEDVEVKVLDRWALDGYIYTKYLNMIGRVSADLVEESKKQVLDHYSKFDCIFYIEPEFDIISDGVRSTGEEFHKTVMDLFKIQIEFLRKKGLRVVQLTGTIEERYSQLLEEIINEK